MVAVRNLIMLGVVAVAACPARTNPQQDQGDDAAVLPPADAGMDAVNVPESQSKGRPPPSRCAATGWTTTATVGWTKVRLRARRLAGLLSGTDASRGYGHLRRGQAGVLRQSRVRRLGPVQGRGDAARRRRATGSTTTATARSTTGACARSARSARATPGRPGPAASEPAGTGYRSASAAPAASEASGARATGTSARPRPVRRAGQRLQRNRRRRLRMQGGRQPRLLRRPRRERWTCDRARRGGRTA